MTKKAITVMIAISAMGCTDVLQTYENTHMLDFVSNNWIDARQEVTISFDNDSFTMFQEADTTSGTFTYHKNTLILNDVAHELTGSRDYGFCLKLKGNKRCGYYFISLQY